GGGCVGRVLGSRCWYRRSNARNLKGKNQLHPPASSARRRRMTPARPTCGQGTVPDAGANRWATPGRGGIGSIPVTSIAGERRDDPDGIRTRVAAWKGPCPSPLDRGAGGGLGAP